MSVLNFKHGETWLYRGVKLLFERRLGDGLLYFLVQHSLSPFQLRDHDGAGHTPDEAWALQAFADGDLVKPNVPNGSAARKLAAKREYDTSQIEELDPQARLRAFVCRGLDRLKARNFCDEKLRDALARLWISEPAIALTFRKPAIRTVRRWLKERGSTGARLLREMLSMSGRVPRSRRFPELTLKALSVGALRYWASPKIDMRDAYALFRTRLIRVNRMRRRRGMPLLKLPSDETFRKEVRANENYETYALKFGEKKAKARFSASGEGLKADRILELGCMDHTMMDSVVVLDAASGLPMGRPWLTVLIDVKSRCVVGWVVSFENPSLYLATECVKRANRPKLHLLNGKDRYKRFAYIFGRFDEIIVDNGWELAGVSFEDAMADAGVTVRWAPIKEPTYKAIVERFFGTLNTKLNNKVPGATLKPHLLRELEIDPSKDAVLSLDDLEDLIWEATCLYHFEEHSRLSVPPGAVWEAGVEAHGIDVIGDDVQLDRMLGTLKKDARLTRRGVEFEGLRYHQLGRTEALLRDLIPLLPVRQRGRDKVSIPIKLKYNPADLAEVQVWNEATHSYVSLPCEDDAYATGLSLHQHQVLKRWTTEKGLAFSSRDERLEARAELVRKVRALCPELGIKERRNLRRLLRSPTVQRIPGDGVTFALAEPRHDGLGPIISHGTLASERRDGGDPPRRPARGGRGKGKRQKVATTATSPSAAGYVFTPQIWKGFGE